MGGGAAGLSRDLHRTGPGQPGDRRALPPDDGAALDSPSPDVSPSLVPRRQPFLYLTAALIVGICISEYVGAYRYFPAAAWTLCVGLILAAILFLARRKDGAVTIALLLAFTAAGALLANSRAKADPSRLMSLYETGVITADDPVYLTGVLARPPESAPSAFHLDLKAETVRKGDVVVPATGSAKLIVPLRDEVAAKEFSNLSLDYGARVRLLVRLERARNFKNPGSPDFNEYLERQGYELKGAVKSPLLIERLGDAPENSMLGRLYEMRRRVLDLLDAHLHAPASGTLKAMLVDNRHFLDEQVAERLREGGTYHVLSISGMHISIIAWALLGGFLGLDAAKLRRRGLIHVLLTITAIWAYAVAVGLAPPVTRSALMITVGLLGPLLFRRSASVNTVALAAFVMLAPSPDLLTDPGFQLSFIAVAAIVALALPVARRLQTIGEWRPSANTPHPPGCPKWVRAAAELLFWNEREFRKEMRRSPIRYRLDKSKFALLLNRLRLQWALRSLLLLIVTSAAIQLATLPLSAMYFNRITPIGVLLNALTGIVTAVLMFGAVLAILAANLSAWLAAQAAAVVDAAHFVLVNSISPFSGVFGATFRVAHYEGWHRLLYGTYFVPVAGLVWLTDRWRPVDTARLAASTAGSGKAGARPWYPRWPIGLTLIALGALCIAVAYPRTITERGRLTVYFLDVGQGDAAVVIFPGGATMLIDAGGEMRFRQPARGTTKPEGQMADPQAAPEPGGVDGREAAFRDDSLSIGETVVSRFLWSKGIRRIDYLLATHSDADHINGFSRVAQNFEIGQAIIAHASLNDPKLNRFAAPLRARGVPMGVVEAGQRFNIDGVAIEILWPSPEGLPDRRSDNQDSVVLRLQYGSVAVLMAGDIDERCEQALVNSGLDLRADVLKVPHHGSKTSSSEAFIDQVRPNWAVISVGERSRFGHPHPAVVERYVKRGIGLIKTGVSGTVTVQTDGNALDVKTYGGAGQK